jgi:hypothetical protein
VTIATQAEEIFFLGMQHGYACGGTPLPHPSLIGWKQIIFRHESWTLMDEWNSKGGRTIIHREQFIVWIMRYSGKYPKTAIPQLKRSLQASYATNIFHGGRGFKTFGGEPFWYQNEWSGDFIRFAGTESVNTVVKPEQREPYIVKIGFHDYWGGMLI